MVIIDSFAEKAAGTCMRKYPYIVSSGNKGGSNPTIDFTSTNSSVRKQSEKRTGYARPHDFFSTSQANKMKVYKQFLPKGKGWKSVAWDIFHNMLLRGQKLTEVDIALMTVSEANAYRVVYFIRHHIGCEVECAKGDSEHPTYWFISDTNRDKYLSSETRHQVPIKVGKEQRSFEFLPMAA
ncbi:hypothetical protein [Enterovibrio norvegicus]|uniref:hypothetical protein n=1 Tax=Enterovibrio norvegicus TaxID=188144 RepID=UPI000C8413CA|nr:hypothetical protein [Enterovibrio norvegicus]PMN73763.1 hypothetical protein BCT27_01775 [Enterovibrio norvegicus]